MAKKIVLCIDGTGDFAADNPTNVFRLFCELDKSDPDNQAVYYDGGVGTLIDNKTSVIQQRINQGLDLAFGTSLKDNFIKAYTFLVDHYEDGAEVYVFGFSRGAYGARVLCGIVELFGIVRPEQRNLSEYIWQYYRKYGRDLFQKAAEFRKHFARDTKTDTPITYLGIYDTVSTIGLIFQKTFTFTAQLNAIAECRHAVATDELRNMFPENILRNNPQKPRDHTEVWFSGVHRDVGGGGKPGTRALCRIPYEWVTAPIRSKLSFIPSQLADTPPDPCCPLWNQGYFLTAGYGVIAVFPQRIWTWFRKGPDAKGRVGKKKLYILRRWLHIRDPFDNSKIHCSIIRRANDPDLKYLPTKILKSQTAFANNTFQAYCDCGQTNCPSRAFPNTIVV